MATVDHWSRKRDIRILRNAVIVPVRTGEVGLLTPPEGLYGNVRAIRVLTTMAIILMRVEGRVVALITTTKRNTNRRSSRIPIICNGKVRMD